MKKMKKIISGICAIAMLSAAFGTTSFAATLKAGLQSDGSYLIGDFTDSTTAAAWADTSTTTVDKYDAVLKGLSLGWVQTDSSGSYLNTYKTDVFSTLDFADYDNFELSFNLGKNANLGVTSLGNYLTIVLSTAEKLTDYGSYKKDECLIYELPLSSYALNEDVSVSIPLSSFVTQFDGMAGGVQGTADGTTSLSDIKSIGLFGGYAGFFGAKNTAAAPSGWTWLFKNSGQNENMSCGFMLYNMSLTNATDARAELDKHMTQYTTVSDDIELPTTLEGFDGTISWASNSAAIGIDGTVTKQDAETTVTLTATITNADGTSETATYNVTVAAKVKLAAGLQADGSYLIGDFTDSTTAAAWANTSSAAEDKYDTAFKTLSLNWVQTGSFGSYLSTYEKDVFSDLDFTEYDNFNISFYLNEDNSKTINNYLTIVLSTAESVTDYGKFKNDECLMYEIPLSGYAVNEKVSVSIPLSDFVTQFDGKSGGVQGTADGTTSLADIKSIALLGGNAAQYGATGMAATPSGWTWLFKNSGQNNGMACGFLLYDMSLTSDPEEPEVKTIEMTRVGTSEEYEVDGVMYNNVGFTVQTDEISSFNFVIVNVTENEEVKTMAYDWSDLGFNTTVADGSTVVIGIQINNIPSELVADIKAGLADNVVLK